LLIDRARPHAAAKMRGSTEEGSKKNFRKPPHDGYKKNAEFSADLKNEKCTYKKLFQKYMLNWDLHQKWQVFLE
jgi:hypothetical protein